MTRFLLPLLLLATRLSAQEVMIRQVLDPVSDTHVEVLALFTKPSPGGYFPVRVKIANNLGVEKSARLRFESSGDYGDQLKTTSTFDFAAAPGKSVTRDILVPVCPPSGSYAYSTNIEATLSGSLGTSGSSTRSNIKPDQPAVLMSEALYTPHASMLDKLTASRFPSHSGDSEFAAKFDPRQLPDDWLAFSGYDSVVMTDLDWTGVPPGARNAILSWVRLGGQLIIYAASENATAGSLGLPEETSFGSILLKGTQLTVDLPATIMKDVTGNRQPPRQASLRSDFSGTWPLQDKFGKQTFRYGLFVAVLVIFSMLVGPVNLFVFAKAGYRHRLFITTPIISLAASLLLVGLIFVQDGFGGSGIRRVLMEVRPDSGLNAAFLHQEQFSRTGMLMGSDFTIPSPVAFSPVPIARSRWARFTESGGAKGMFDLLPADGKIQAGGDWFQSRSEHGHALSAMVSTRGRIEKTDTPDTWLSTFEFPIDVIYFLNEAKQWHRAEGIEAGKRFSAKLVDSSTTMAELDQAANGFGPRNRDSLNDVLLRPGHFIAITSHAPGIDTHPAIRWKETVTVITGPVVSP